MGARLRRIVTFIVALLLHLAILLIPLREPQRRQKVQPIELVALEKPKRGQVPFSHERHQPEPSTELPKPKPKPLATIERPSVESKPVEPAEPEPVERSAGFAEAPVKAEPDLFPEEVINGIAQKSTPDTFERRMKKWTDDFRAVQNAKNGQATPEVVALGERLYAWFIPTGEQVERNSLLGLGVLSTPVPYLEFYSSGKANTPSDAMARKFGNRLEMDPRGKALLRGDLLVFCVGFCSDVGHEVARLEALIAVSHDPSGLPASWRVKESSGDRDFDAEALSAVEATVEFTAKDVITGGRPPRSSHWIFRALAYRYGRKELIADPGFIPPGKPLEEHSSIMGETTLVREVHLVAIRFHDEYRDGGPRRPGD